MSKAEVWIRVKLSSDGLDEAEMCEVVERVLDGGALQEAVEEYAADMRDSGISVDQVDCALSPDAVQETP